MLTPKWPARSSAAFNHAFLSTEKIHSGGDNDPDTRARLITVTPVGETPHHPPENCESLNACSWWRDS
jgi:hypothetical protein